ncbi:MAG: hypothetical protein PUG85_02395 [Oscillospiraceae bacterium]|nr:hypothetical protein [Oscillospiraceae bacterium]MDY2509590.1 hypothetical protein [Ruminococcus callidus]
MQQKDYFKGWYFKCSNKNKTIAFIPAFHQSNCEKTASLQMITDNAAFNIPFHSLQYQENPLTIKIGENVFSEKGIQLVSPQQPVISIIRLSAKGTNVVMKKVLSLKM